MSTMLAVAGIYAVNAMLFWYVTKLDNRQNAPFGPTHSPVLRGALWPILMAWCGIESIIYMVSGTAHQRR